MNEIWVIAGKRIAANVLVQEHRVAEQKLREYQGAGEQET
jgi:hypothetical protein